MIGFLPSGRDTISDQSFAPAFPDRVEPPMEAETTDHVWSLEEIPGLL